MNTQVKLSRLQSLSSLPIDSLAALIGSVICLSFSPISLSFIAREIGPNAAAFNRFWIAAIAFVLLNTSLAVGKREKKIQPEQEKPHLVKKAILLIVDGILLSVGSVCWAWSLSQTSIAHSSLMHNLVPIFTVLGGWLVFGQTFDRRFLLGMLVAIAGAILLEANQLFSWSISQQLLGDLAALLSAVFFGIHPLIIEQLRISLNPITIMAWSSTASALFLFPVTLIVEGQLFPSSATGWLSVIALAFFGQMLGVGLWAYCLKNVSAGFGSLVALVIPALSAVEAWVIFSESLTLLTSVSFLVILLGMYLAISSTSAIKSGVESSD